MKTINKTKVAEAQLVTAIKLFFENEDEVSIHTLAHAANEILDILCAKRNLTRGVLQEGLMRFVKPEHHKTVTKKVFESKNFFKHGDSDANKQLEWNPDVTEYVIWDGSSLLRRLLNERVPGEVIVYSLWFRIHHDDLWEGSIPLDTLLPDAKPLLAQLSKKEFFETAMHAQKMNAFQVNQF